MNRLDEFFERYDQYILERRLRLIAIIIAALGLLICFCYGAIFLYPEVPFNPFPPSTKEAQKPTDTPTVEGTPTFPPTWTPTSTPTETPTFTPSPTPTYTPTRTPVPTPTPTITPTPSPPPPPPPPPPPTPMPYDYTEALAGPRCDGTRAFGSVFNIDGLPQSGIEVRVIGEDGTAPPATVTNVDGNYEIFLHSGPRDGTWWISLYQSGMRVSPIYGFKSSQGGCKSSGKQIFMVNWQRQR